MKRIAVCFLTHSFNIVPQYLFYKIKKDLCIDDKFEVFAMIETSFLSEKPNTFEYNYGSYSVELNIFSDEFNGGKIPLNISKNNSLLFTWEELINKYKSQYHIEGFPHVGNCCYPFLELYHKLEKQKRYFDYYIFVEDDIFYTGNYQELIDKIKVVDYDVVRYSVQNSQISWYWLDKYCNSTNNRTFSEKRLTNGLLQLYSLSHKAIDYLYNEIITTPYYAHHELLVNTLLDNNDELTKHEYKDDLPTHIYVWERELNQNIIDTGFQMNELYHPIKKLEYLMNANNI